MTSRETKPDNSVGENSTDRHPGVVNPAPPGQVIVPVPTDGNPLKVTATCDQNGLKGTATGTVTNVEGVADAVGSTTQAEMNKATGEYTSTGRAFVTGLQGAGPLDAVSSFMQVHQMPGAKPTVSYRLSIFNSKDANSGLTQDGFTLSGSNVPVDQLVKQFNSQADTISAALAAIGPFGLNILAPQVGTTPSTETGTTGLPFIQAPAVTASLGTHLRDGTIGEHEQARLGSVTFTGTYNQN